MHKTLIVYYQIKRRNILMSMSRHQGKGCRCICTGYQLDLRSVEEDSCNCPSCLQVIETCDKEETLVKQPSEARGNKSALRRKSSSDTMLVIQSPSQDNRPHRTGSDISTNPGSVFTDVDGSFRRLRVFCTCSLDSAKYLRQVVEMLKTLKQNGFEVRTADRCRNNLNVRDMNIAVNIQDWLEVNIARADFVIACISPKYLEDIAPPADDVPDTDDSAFLTRYIYDQLRAEYYVNKCRHRKLIPVLFSEADVPMTHIPSFMKTTIVYKYPKEQRDLISFLNIRRNLL